MSLFAEVVRKIFKLPLPEEREEVCKSCETLKAQLAQVNYEKKELIQTLLEIVKPKVEEKSSISEDIKPVNTSRFMPFAVKRQMLEEQDRMRARAMKEVQETNSKSVEELEKVVGVDHSKPLNEELANG